jgi:hypothetical protein
VDAFIGSRANQHLDPDERTIAERVVLHLRPAHAVGRCVAQPEQATKFEAHLPAAAPQGQNLGERSPPLRVLIGECGNARQQMSNHAVASVDALAQDADLRIQGFTVEHRLTRPQTC